MSVFKYVLLGTDSDYKREFEMKPTSQEVQDFMNDFDIVDIEDVVLFKLGKELKLKKLITIDCD